MPSLGGALAAAAVVLSVAGSGYCLFALFAVWRFRRRQQTLAPRHEPVSILKPLAGADPELYRNLRSFLEQDWPEVQLVCGVAVASDPAAAVVERLKADLPDRDIMLVVEGRRHGGNRKVSNLINMLPKARHDLMVIADSDMRVDRDYLASIIPRLQQPGVGLVTCLYRGRAVDGVWSMLGALHINAGFVPQVLVGHLSGAREGCYGATMACRRETLERIGGLAALADHLADDWLLGERVRRTEARVVLAPYLVDDMVDEPTLAALLQHEYRWARTIRLLAPWGQLGTVITNPVPLALLALLLGGGPLVLALALTCRLALVYGSQRAFGVDPAPLWAVPLRDLLSFLVWIACWFGSTVAWRGERYRIGADGKLTGA